MAQQPPGIGDLAKAGLAASPAPGPIKRMGYALGLSPRAFQVPYRLVDWIIPLAIILAIMLVGLYTLQDLHVAKAGEQMRAQIQSNPRLSEEQRADAIERLEKGTGRGVVLGSLLGGSIGGVLLGILVSAALLLAIVNFGLGGNARFAHLWFAVSLSWVPKGIESILFTTLARARSTLEISFGPAAAVTSDGVMKRILSVFDVFDIWMIAIQIVGIHVLTGLTSRKAATAVIALWVLWWLLAIAIAIATRGVPGAS